MTRPTMAPSPMVSIVSPIWPPMPSERTSGIVGHRYPLDQGDADGHEEEGGEAVEFQAGHEEQQDQDADPDYEERHDSSPLNCVGLCMQMLSMYVDGG